MVTGFGKVQRYPRNGKADDLFGVIAHYEELFASMVELVYTLVLEASAVRIESSSLSTRTMLL